MSKLRTYLQGGASTDAAPGTVNTWSNEQAGPFIGALTPYTLQDLFPIIMSTPSTGSESLDLPLK